MLTVQQRGRGSVQHARGALQDPLGHQRGTGAHRLHGHLARGTAFPLQRPVVQDLHHGLFQGSVGTDGQQGEGSPLAEPGKPLCSFPALKTPRKRINLTHPGRQNQPRLWVGGPGCPHRANPPGSPGQDVVIDQRQGEQPSVVQPPQVDLIPKD